MVLERLPNCETASPLDLDPGLQADFRVRLYPILSSFRFFDTATLAIEHDMGPVSLPHMVPPTRTTRRAHIIPFAQNNSIKATVLDSAAVILASSTSGLGNTRNGELAGLVGEVRVLLWDNGLVHC